MGLMNPMSTQSMAWGSPLEFWDAWGFRLMIAGAVVGLLALGATFASSFILYRVVGVAEADAKHDAGRVLINRDWQAAVGQCPLYPQKRTFVSALSMSALCHKQTLTFLQRSIENTGDPQIRGSQWGA
jgi:hypothetical protein